MTEWRNVPLRRIFRIVNGGTPTSDPENWDGDVRWATPVDLGQCNGGLITSTARTLTPQGLQSGSAAVPGEALVVSTRAPIGYVAQTVEALAFNQGCRGLAPERPLDIRYYRYVLASLAARLQARGHGSTFVELSTEALASTPLPLPPPADQGAIADFLDAETARIDALIAKKRHLIAALRERRAVVTLSAVCGETTSSAARIKATLPWLTSHPDYWTTAKLTLVAQLGSGHTPSRDHPEWWEDCSVPWITTGEVVQMRDDRIEYVTHTREQISDLGLANSSATVHPAGTVVLSRTASAGYSAIMGTDMATSQDFVTWTCGPLLEPRYLLLCLRAMRSDLLERLAQGSTHKTIYMPDVASIRIPLPPLEEQREIDEETWRRLRPLDDIVDRLDRQIALLQEHRQALITAAVTGDLAVPGTAAAAVHLEGTVTVGP